MFFSEVNIESHQPIINPSEQLALFSLWHIKNRIWPYEKKRLLNLVQKRSVSFHGIMANELDCNIIFCKFKFQSHYYIHFQTNTFRKNLNPLYLPAMYQIVPLMFLYKDGFGIKSPMKVDMPFNKKVKPIVDLVQANSIYFLNVSWDFNILILNILMLIIIKKEIWLFSIYVQVTKY